eukprot:jgi/Botrbrau1/18677/Bobra.0386s0006.1
MGLHKTPQCIQLYNCTIVRLLRLQLYNCRQYVLQYVLSRNKPGNVKTKTRVHVGAKSEFLNVPRVLQVLDQVLHEALVFGIYYGLDTV